MAMGDNTHNSAVQTAICAMVSGVSFFDAVIMSTFRKFLVYIIAGMVGIVNTILKWRLTKLLLKIIFKCGTMFIRPLKESMI